MKEIQHLRAQKQVSDAINTRNGPNTDELHDLMIGADVLVWREGNAGHTASWEGPYTLIAIDGESCVLKLPHGNTTFRSTSVKPYFSRPDDDVTVDDVTPNKEVNSRGEIGDIGGIGSGTAQPMVDPPISNRSIRQR